jgi:hypothetical protein
MEGPNIGTQFIIDECRWIHQSITDGHDTWGGGG